MNEALDRELRDFVMDAVNALQVLPIRTRPHDDLNALAQHLHHVSDALIRLRALTDVLNEQDQSRWAALNRRDTSTEQH